MQPVVFLKDLDLPSVSSPDSQAPPLQRQQIATKLGEGKGNGERETHFL